MFYKKFKMEKCNVDKLKVGDIVYVGWKDSYYMNLGIVIDIGETILHKHKFVEVFGFTNLQEGMRVRLFHCEIEKMLKLVDDVPKPTEKNKTKKSKKKR